jgi:hypothetical protein
MRLFAGISPRAARPLIGALCAMGSLVCGGCTPDEVNQPNQVNRPEVPIDQTVAPTNGLIGEWKLDEMGGTIAYDTRNGYNDTLQGGATFVSGRIGRALNLNNGTSGTGGKYAEMPSNPTLDNVQEGDYTLSAWFYAYSVPPDAVVENRNWAIVVKSGQHMGLIYENSKRFTMRHYLVGDNVLVDARSATIYAPNAWHHVAGVVSKSGGTIKIYVDGALQATSTFTPNTAAREYGTSLFRIGRARIYWDADGKVDQVRIYNRALSAAEISDLYGETTNAAGLSNCIGADSLGDRTTYSDRRVFLESQGWWGQNTNGNVPKYGHAEHIHVGMCFPLRDTVSGTTTFIVRVLGHNLPLNSVIRSTSLHDPDQGPDQHITLATIDWDHMVTQAEHDDPIGVVLWDTVQVITDSMPNGLRELRNLTIVDRPNDTRLEASSGWCWTIENGGGTPVASGTCTGTGANFTMARGWYDCFEYKIAEVRNWDPYAAIPHGVNYTLSISGRDGAGDNIDMTGWEVRLDPNFHRDTLGFKVDSGGGSVFGRSVTIPAARMTAGLHRLVVMGSANNYCTTPTGEGIKPQNGEVSAVLAIPLKVN